MGAPRNTEIERKFLVNRKKWEALDKPAGLAIVQCYLSTDPDKTIRIRVMGDQGFLTIKGRTKTLARPEFEYEIPTADVHEMAALFADAKVEKTRYRIPVGDHVWDVDEFHGANADLLLAEVELASEDEAFSRPDWLAEEVSDDGRYFNANLLHHPFGSW